MPKYRVMCHPATEGTKEFFTILQDIAWYGEHFRGRHGRVEPWQVWTLDKGKTWIHAPTGEQVTRIGPGAMPQDHT